MKLNETPGALIEGSPGLARWRKNMITKSKMKHRFTAVLLIALGAFVLAGCSHSSTGTNMSADAYKQAAAGSAMTPSQHEQMMAAIAAQQSSQAAQQMKDQAVQHVPPPSHS
jgi:hypothetical protein